MAQRSRKRRLVGRTVYLTPEVAALLRDAARRERRSESTLAAMFIEQGLGTGPAARTGAPAAVPAGR